MLNIRSGIFAGSVESRVELRWPKIDTEVDVGIGRANIRAKTAGTIA
jgi:hypothetical protein